MRFTARLPLVLFLLALAFFFIGAFFAAVAAESAEADPTSAVLLGPSGIVIDVEAGTNAGAIESEALPTIVAFDVASTPLLFFFFDVPFELFVVAAVTLDALAAPTVLAARTRVAFFAIEALVVAAFAERVARTPVAFFAIEARFATRDLLTARRAVGAFFLTVAFLTVAFLTVAFFFAGAFFFTTAFFTAEAFFFTAALFVEVELFLSGVAAILKSANAIGALSTAASAIATTPREVDRLLPWDFIWDFNSDLNLW